MPLTHKGEEIHEHIVKEYGPKKADEVFYASRNAGAISGVDAGAPEQLAPGSQSTGATVPDGRHVIG